MLVQLFCYCQILTPSWQGQPLPDLTLLLFAASGVQGSQSITSRSEWIHKCTRGMWLCLPPLQNPRGEHNSTYALLVVKTWKTFPIFLLFLAGLIYKTKCNLFPSIVINQSWLMALSFCARCKPNRPGLRKAIIKLKGQIFPMSSNFCSYQWNHNMGQSHD